MTPGHRRHGHSRNIVHRDARSRKEVVELGHEAISLCVEPYAGIDRCKGSEVTSCGIQPLSSSSSISNQISIPRESLPRSTPLVDCNLPRRPRRSTTRLPRVSATRAPSETRVPTTKHAAPLITYENPALEGGGQSLACPDAVAAQADGPRARAARASPIRARLLGPWGVVEPYHRRMMQMIHASSPQLPRQRQGSRPMRCPSVTPTPRAPKRRMRRRHPRR